MKDFIKRQKMIYPDFLEMMQKRYYLLLIISLFEPIGRRGIVEQTSYPERFVRNEIELLTNLQLVQMTTKGVLTTDQGREALHGLLEYYNELSGISKIEERLLKKLTISKVIVVPGNSDKTNFVKAALGKATIQYLKKTINQDSTIAVTGGTTMAAIAEEMVPLGKYKCIFVPARGGVGEKVEIQANTIAAKMGKAENGYYHLLHVPDPLSESLYQSLIEEPSIIETLNIIKNAHIVIHGIGDALTMARRRKTTRDIVDKLDKREAVSEAFGYYFNAEGEVVHKVRTFGIHLDDLTYINNVITVAGGKSKARAIVSYMAQGKTDVLITDEAAASEILSIIN